MPEPFNPPLYMFDKAMSAVKTAARIEDYARAFTKLDFSGKSLRGICPVHGGDNRSSFAVYPEKQSYYCFRCNEGGDVVNLCQRVEQHNTLWEAMLSLAERFGVELPQRQPSWSVRQDEKAQDRARLERIIANRYQRRLFRVFGEYLRDIGHPDERREEARLFFEDLRPLAEAMAIRFVHRKGVA